MKFTRNQAITVLSHTYFVFSLFVPTLRSSVYFSVPQHNTGRVSSTFQPRCYLRRTTPTPLYACDDRQFCAGIIQIIRAVRWKQSARSKMPADGRKVRFSVLDETKAPNNAIQSWACTQQKQSLLPGGTIHTTRSAKLGPIECRLFVLDRNTFRQFVRNARSFFVRMDFPHTDRSFKMQPVFP